MLASSFSLQLLTTPYLDRVSHPIVRLIKVVFSFPSKGPNSDPSKECMIVLMLPAPDELSSKAWSVQQAISIQPEVLAGAQAAHRTWCQDLAFGERDYPAAFLVG